MEFKMGKLPARPGAVKLKFGDYVNLAKLPSPPDHFGHSDMVRQDWGILGNDQWGDCFWAGAAHEHMVWGAIGGHKYTFSKQTVLNDYAKATGFNSHDPDTDAGTDMQAGAKYRQDVGITDTEGNVHKIEAYLALDPGNVQQQKTAAWLFGAVGIGFRMPAATQSQFSHHKPWDVVAGSHIEGGHYVPLMDAKGGMTQVCTWGRMQDVTDAFFDRYNDESLVYLTSEILLNGETIEGFNIDNLRADLESLRS